MKRAVTILAVLAVLGMGTSAMAIEKTSFQLAVGHGDAPVQLVGGGHSHGHHGHGHGYPGHYGHVYRPHGYYAPVVVYPRVYTYPRPVIVTPSPSYYDPYRGSVQYYGRGLSFGIGW